MMIRTWVVAAGVVALLAVPVAADTLYLSDFLGVPSGSTTTSSNPPVFTVIQHTNGIGADCAGSFSSQPVRFTGTTDFAKALGMHSTADGFSEVRFDLIAMAPPGMFVDSFAAQAGIDLNSNGFGTTRFQVLLDDVLAFDEIVAAADTPEIVNVSTAGVSVLTLRTGSISHNGAHSAWADALVTTAVPEPATLSLLALGSLSLLRRRR